jgi:hypothetical protein
MPGAKKVGGRRILQTLKRGKERERERTLSFFSLSLFSQVFPLNVRFLDEERDP